MWPAAPNSALVGAGISSSARRCASKACACSAASVWPPGKTPAPSHSSRCTSASRLSHVATTEGSSAPVSERLKHAANRPGEAPGRAARYGLWTINSARSRSIPRLRRSRGRQASIRRGRRAPSGIRAAAGEGGSSASQHRDTSCDNRTADGRRGAMRDNRLTAAVISGRRRAIIPASL